MCHSIVRLALFERLNCIDYFRINLFARSDYKIISVHVLFRNKSERIVSIPFCEHSVGRDRDELVLAVPREVERGSPFALDARDASSGVVRVRAARPGRKAVALPKGVGDCRYALGASRAVARRVVGVGDAAVGGEAVEVVVSVDAVERIGADIEATRCNAPYGVVLVGDTANGRSTRRSPRYVRNSVHDVVSVLYHKSVAVGGRSS